MVFPILVYLITVISLAQMKQNFLRHVSNPLFLDDIPSIAKFPSPNNEDNLNPKVIRSTCTPMELDLQ